MLEDRALSIEQGIVIYVKLVNEVVDVWRPVQAIQINENRYKLVEEQSVPEDEDWEFAPGEVVEVTTRSFEGGMRKIASRKI